MYYKVTNPDLKSTISSQMANYPEIYDRVVVQYVFEKWVRPKIEGTKLFIFDDFRIARNHAYIEDHIYECEVEGVTDDFDLCFHPGYIGKAMNSLLNYGKLIYPFNSKHLLMRYALACDSVKLTKRLNRNGENYDS